MTRCAGGFALLSCVVCVLRQPSIVRAVNTHGWSPSVSLTDDGLEPDGDGMCLDIVGFGTGIDCSRLQTHSCKERGQDTQFEYDARQLRLRAVNFAGDTCVGVTPPTSGGCVTANASKVGARLSLSACDADEPKQQFIATVVDDGMELRLGGSQDPALCLSSGGNLRVAGTMWARSLELGDCATTIAALKHWTVDPVVTAAPSPTATGKPSSGTDPDAETTAPTATAADSTSASSSVDVPTSLFVLTFVGLRLFL